jgi:ribosomal protein S18 acetylase RimI-like enzyme
MTMAMTDDHLSLFAAARLHARRNHIPAICSILTLLASDHRVTHPNGGVMAVTQLQHRWLSLAVATTAELLGVLLTAALIASRWWALGAVSAVATLTIVIAFLPRALNRVAAARRWPPHPRTWMLTDIATEPHQGIGDQLMTAITTQADNANTWLVLQTHRSNHTALRLYQRHGFTPTSRQRSHHKIALQRPPSTRRNAHTPSSPPPRVEQP